MADNYLENRMEAYRSGSLATHNRTSASMRAPRKQNQLTLTYQPMSVFVVACSPDALVTETIGAFTAVGCRVAFTTIDDAKESALVAQRTGARYYPGKLSFDDIIADISGHWGAPDLMLNFVALQDISSVLPEPTRVIDAANLSIEYENVAPSTLARHLLYLSHPDNAFLLD